MSNSHKDFCDFSEATLLILPVLRIPINKYPNFVDSYVMTHEETAENKIVVLTSKSTKKPKNKFSMTDISGLVSSKELEGSEYIAWIFEIPTEWESDVRKCICGNIRETSKDYKKLVYSIFPSFKKELSNILN